MALATLVHALVTSVAARRRDLALLKTLGFTKRQILAAVGWQASVIVAIALLVGLPLGIAGGRVAWQAFAHQVGVIGVADVPALVLGLVAIGVVLVANGVATVPGRAAARTPVVSTCTGPRRGPG